MCRIDPFLHRERRVALRGSVDEIAGLFQSTPKSSGMLTSRECAFVETRPEVADERRSARKWEG